LDQVSGRKADRPQFKAAMRDARKRKFDVLLFWSLDRLTREGVLKTLLILNRLSGYGVKYRSLQEQWIDSLGDFSDASEQQESSDNGLTKKPVHVWQASLS